MGGEIFCGKNAIIHLLWVVAGDWGILHQRAVGLYGPQRTPAVCQYGTDATQIFFCQGRVEQIQVDLLSWIGVQQRGEHYCQWGDIRGIERNKKVEGFFCMDGILRFMTGKRKSLNGHFDLLFSVAASTAVLLKIRRWSIKFFTAS